jgi:uncharacterized protein
MRPNRARSECSTRSMWTILLFLLFAVPALAAEPNSPLLTGRVVDEAGILNPATIKNLTDRLAKHEQTTGEQVVVVTLKSLQGYSIEEFGYQLGRHWGIGQKDKNTGAILIVVPNERKVRIEVGYGLEGKLTDAVSRTIIETDIVPNFRRGDFAAGVLSGTTSILKVLRSGSATGTEPDVNSNALRTAVGADSGWDYPAMMAIFFIFMIIRSLLPWRHGIYRRVGRSYGYSSFPDGGFSGGGGGGFSGGGGSFGGGGASGSW